MSGFGYDVLGFGSGSGVAPTEVDEDFNRTSFLSHFDAANNGVNNAFDDGSSSNHTITAAGNVTQGSFGPFARPEGYWGVHFDTGSEGLAVVYGTTTHSYWNSNFTWEFWINSADIKTCAIISSWALAGFQYSSYAIHMQSNGKMALYNANLPGQGNLNGATAINDGAWHHIAITQVDDGGSTKYYRIFVDGVLDAYSTASAWTQGASDSVITFGSESPEAGTSYKADRRLAGVMSNMRLNTTIVYSTSSTTIGATIFTPPSSPLSAITGTAILTLQSNRFVDKSSNAYGITNTGAPAVSAFGPFLTDAAYDPAVNGASAFFDGSNDRLVTPDSADFDFGTGDFTIELFFNYRGSISNRWLIGATNQWHVRLKTATNPSRLGEIVIYIQGGSEIIYVTSVDLANSGWHHIAIARQGTNLRHFLNGVLGKTTTNNQAVNANTELYIGASAANAEDWGGHITDLRIVKGTAVYTGNFTPPTAPLTAITNTKLLLNMANGQAIDSAAQSNLALYGNAKLSTGQAKFGDTSMYFDGTGDYATLPNSASNNLGGANWTIEGWLYLTANAGTGNDEFAVASKFGGSSNRSWLARIANGNKLTFWYINNSGTQVELTPDTRVLSLNTWYHVAWVKNSNLKVYINGVGATLASSDFQIRDGTDLIQLSGRASGDNMYEGYIDDFRISSMARYTNNFTAPTKPFADKGQ